MIVAAVIAATAIGGLYLASVRREAPDAPGALQQVVPLTSYPGREAQPSFSPDGSQVAFTWDGDQRANQDVYVKVIGSERPLRLTADPAVDGSPAWSPDGSRIAFLRERPWGGSQVRLISPTGGAERPLAEVAASPDYGLAWSSDGRRLAAVDRSSPETPLHIVLLDAETGTRSPLTSPGSLAGRGDAWPIFSPDGRSVAFKRSMAPAAHFVCVVPASGGEPRRLAPTSPVTSPLAWTPDGREIVFTALSFVAEGGSPVLSTRANTGAPPVLWRISAHGGAAHQLVGSANALGVAVSREGNRLAFTQQTSDWDVWRIDLRGRTGDAQTRFIASTRFDGNAQFSPDERRVAFTSARSGGLEIWVADDQAGNPRRLTFLGKTGSAGSPRWSPDGTHIAFDYLAEGDTGADVFVVSASGGPPRRVTTSSSPDVRPCWSSDGRFIYFASHRSGEWQVWKVPLEGETVESARQVTRGGGYSSIESPDGEQLYFSRRLSLPEDPRNAIWRLPVRGGDEEVVIESLSSSDTNWDVTAEGIYFVDRGAEESPSEERWVVRFFDFARRRVSDVSTLRYPPRLAGPALSVSSGGRWLLVSQLQEECDLMLVENFR
jgi:Tol biopolymer transport system component